MFNDISLSNGIVTFLGAASLVPDKEVLSLIIFESLSFRSTIIISVSEIPITPISVKRRPLLFTKKDESNEPLTSKFNIIGFANGILFKDASFAGLD